MEMPGHNWAEGAAGKAREWGSEREFAMDEDGRVEMQLELELELDKPNEMKVTPTLSRAIDS
jgi:hypothetical protein